MPAPLLDLRQERIKRVTTRRLMTNYLPHWPCTGRRPFPKLEGCAEFRPAPFGLSARFLLILSYEKARHAFLQRMDDAWCQPEVNRMPHGSRTWISRGTWMSAKHLTSLTFTRLRKDFFWAGHDVLPSSPSTGQIFQNPLVQTHLPLWFRRDCNYRPCTAVLPFL